MTRPWDRRQLVIARGKLQRAHRNVELAIERLDSGNADSVLRVMWAIKEAWEASEELRRFARRRGEDA